jgi:hypothetical protein
MENKQLLEKLDRLGYPLFTVTDDFDVNKTLAQVVETGDGRFWEGFPVLLANAAKESTFNYAEVERSLQEEALKKKFKDLFLLSLALYKANKLKFGWAGRYLARSSELEKNRFNEFGVLLGKADEFNVAGRSFSPERLNNAFQNYFKLEMVQARDLEERHGALSLEFALSQVFSPKQKELFKKKLKGELLTKTEKEYFSRAVKKKVSALANSELHRLSQKLLES